MSALPLPATAAAASAQTPRAGNAARTRTKLLVLKPVRAATCSNCAEAAARAKRTAVCALIEREAGTAST